MDGTSLPSQASTAFYVFMVAVGAPFGAGHLPAPLWATGGGALGSSSGGYFIGAGAWVALSISSTRWIVEAALYYGGSWHLPLSRDAPLLRLYPWEPHHGSVRREGRGPAQLSRSMAQ